ncbi:MAG: isopentenyl phosphate kinase [Anaerolineales bacterium]|jgi:isopentenyl phosphate kinase
MILLKLGGSLITEKDQPETPRLGTIRRLAIEVFEARRSQPGLRLVIGHGSGSFGHHLASKHQTHKGAESRQDWQGFADVWASANHLNRLVVDALRQAGVPVIAFPPSASALTEGGRLVELAHEPIRLALDHGLVPVVQGDVAFDRKQGSAIVSTEQVLGALVEPLHADCLLLAGLDAGVFADYPDNRTLLSELKPEDVSGIRLRGASSEDVTGGMAAKVEKAFELLRDHPSLEIRIFSAETPNSLLRALVDKPGGTRLVR